MRNRRIAADKGFTVPTSFLESVRFAKFTVDLNGTDAILCSRRLLGFAAIEQREKGPLKQAPGLELEHMRRLHQILQSDGNLIDRLGAGAFLICLYGRARWSDLRFVSHADISGDDFMTLYTTEHKTASVGLKRQQFLPIAVPWEGVTSDPWLRNWLDIYQRCGLNISQKPLGPLLPAPRLDGSFCARPLTTSEAAMWLRGLLKGTNHCETFRSHSLKASLLLWCARAGLDKETRAVLGHHCTALSGSEVVYSRQLQTRALRKLSLILRRVRMGQTLEDDAMKEFGVVSTPLPFTPATAARTPVAMPQQVGLAKPVEQDEVDNSAVTGAVKLAMECEDLQSVKEEQFDLQAVEAAANELTLFPADIVSMGVVEIESSSGSDSESTTSDSSSTTELEPQRDQPSFIEHVPESLDFYRHAKSGILHACKLGETVTKCKLSMNANFRKLGRSFTFRYPKCLRCFPKDNNRIRSVDALASALDASVKRARNSASDR